MGYKQSKYNIIIKDENGTKTIFNSFSNGISEFDPKSYNDLVTANENGEYFQEMVKQGFLVLDKVDETRRVLELHQKYIYNSFPEKMQFTIAPTLRCPLDCYYCFEERHDGCIMSDETADKIIDYMLTALKNNINCKLLHITWFGGEPLLAPNVIYKIGKAMQSYCEQNNIEFTSKMLTSGVLFKEDYFDKLVDEKILTSVQYTLDGDEETFMNTKKGKKGMYDTILRAINYSAQKIETYVRMNVTKLNQDSLLAAIENIIKNCPSNAKIIPYAMPVVDYGMEADNACNLTNDKDINAFRQKIIDILQKYNLYKYDVLHGVRSLSAFCGAMRLCNLTFGPNGEMYRCENLIGNKTHEVGNINDGLYYNDAYYKLPLSKIDDKCLNCEYLPVCWGGCPVHKHIYNKDIDCEAVKESVKYRLNQKL